MDAVIKELNARKAFLGGRDVDTVYLGGGTPSLLAVVRGQR